MTNPTRYTPCPSCDGPGDYACDDCHGEGVVPCWHTGHGDRVIGQQERTIWRRGVVFVENVYECSVCESSYATRVIRQIKSIPPELLAMKARKESALRNALAEDAGPGGDTGEPVTKETK